MNITAATAEAVYQAVLDLLAEYDPMELWGVSCIARGADSVFARAVLDVGGRLEAVLPSRNYREAKVKPEDLPAFDDLVLRAGNVRVLDFDTPGLAAYEAANEVVVGSVDLLVAVWDGQAGQSGGTGSVVEFANERGVPVTVVWPEGAART